MKNEIALTTEKELEIRFSDVDMMGVVWHGTYAKYLEDAREAFGVKYGLSYTTYIVEYTFAPIVELNISYKKPLKYGMTPVVKIIYRPTEAAKIIFDYEIFNPKNGDLFLKARSVQVFMDKNYNLLWESPKFYEAWKKQMGLL